MARDAESHAAEDRKERDNIEARNRADAMIYNTEKTLKEHRDKVGDDDAKNIEEALADTKKAMESGDAGQMKAAQEQLLNASHKLAEAMYSAANAQQTPPAGGPGPNPGPQSEAKKDNVVDAEFVDVDENKK